MKSETFQLKQIKNDMCTPIGARCECKVLTEAVIRHFERIKELPSRARWLLIGGGTVVGLLLSLPAVEAIHYFSSNEFCTGCHSMKTVDETFADWVTGRPPRAPVTGVRLAGVPAVFDCSKARDDLGLAQSPIRQALRDQLLWLRQRGLIARPLPGLDDL